MTTNSNFIALFLPVVALFGCDEPTSTVGEPAAGTCPTSEVTLEILSEATGATPDYYTVEANWYDEGYLLLNCPGTDEAGGRCTETGAVVLTDATVIHMDIFSTPEGDSLAGDLPVAWLEDDDCSAGAVTAQLTYPNCEDQDCG